MVTSSLDSLHTRHLGRSNRRWAASQSLEFVSSQSRLFCNPSHVLTLIALDRTEPADTIFQPFRNHEDHEFECSFL